VGTSVVPTDSRPLLTFLRHLRAGLLHSAASRLVFGGSCSTALAEIEFSRRLLELLPFQSRYAEDVFVVGSGEGLPSFARLDGLFGALRLLRAGLERRLSHMGRCGIELGREPLRGEIGFHNGGGS
jgi:hypothetical protein